MEPSGASVVLFARDHAKVAEFYSGALGVRLATGAP